MKANLKFYEDKEKDIIADLAKYSRQSGILSFTRLLSFIAAVSLIIGAVVLHRPVLYYVGALIFVCFIVLCIVHGKVIDKVNYLNELFNVNSSYIARIKGDFNELRKIADALPFTKKKQVDIILFTKTLPKEDMGNSILPDKVIELSY